MFRDTELLYVQLVTSYQYTYYWMHQGTCATCILVFELLFTVSFFKKKVQIT